MADGPETRRSRDRGDGRLFLGFLVVACLVLAVLVLLLARENRELKARPAAFDAELPEDALRETETVPALALVDANGQAFLREFDRGEGSSLLLVFSAECPACREAFPLWSDLLAGTGPDGTLGGLRVLALRGDMSDTEVPPLPFPVYELAEFETDFMGRIPFVPATVLVGPTGRVERIWYGVPGPEDERALASRIALLAGESPVTDEASSVSEIPE